MEDEEYICRDCMWCGPKDKVQRVAHTLVYYQCPVCGSSDIDLVESIRNPPKCKPLDEIFDDIYTKYYGDKDATLENGYRNIQ